MKDKDHKFRDTKTKIIITSGDPAGIGVEVILKSLKSIKHLNELSILVVGSVELYQYIGSKIGIDLNSLKSFVRFIDVSLDMNLLKLGETNLTTGKHSLECIDIALNYVLKGQSDAIVTGPVDKYAIALYQKSTIEKKKKILPLFKGHTEYMALKSNANHYAMSFLSSSFDLLLMTTHVPIREVSKYLKAQKIRANILLALELQTMRKDNKPLVVMGLNPHAGEKGLIGKEDLMIEKTIKSIYDETKRPIEGPISADTGFMAVMNGKYRTVVACYHDQGLIPLKMLSQRKSVNYTIGIPFVRTSVDHGIAADKASYFNASHHSMLYAIECAKEISLYKKNSSNAEKILMFLKTLMRLLNLIHRRYRSIYWKTYMSTKEMIRECSNFGNCPKK